MNVPHSGEGSRPSGPGVEPVGLFNPLTGQFLPPGNGIGSSWPRYRSSKEAIRSRCFCSSRESARKTSLDRSSATCLPILM